MGRDPNINIDRRELFPTFKDNFEEFKTADKEATACVVEAVRS
jgi:hypothetical protein